MRTLTLAFLVVVLTACAVGAVSQATVADSDRLDDREANETDEEETTDEDGEYVSRVDNDLVITDWGYSNGQFLIDFYAESSTRVSLTEQGSWEEGTASFNFDERRLEEGENTVRFAVTDRDGAAVGIATQQSLAAGGGEILSTGQVTRDPFEHFGGDTGFVSGVSMSLVLAALSAVYVVRREDKGVIEA